MVSTILILLSAWHGACDSLASAQARIMHLLMACCGTPAVLHTGLVLRSPAFSRCVSVFTPHVHCPFDCGKLGLDVVSFMPQSLPKLVKYWLANGMLSLIISSGIPCLAKIEMDDDV